MEDKTITCPVCGKVIHVTEEGYIYIHGDNDTGVRCEGSARRVIIKAVPMTKKKEKPWSKFRKARKAKQTRAQRKKAKGNK